MSGFTREEILTASYSNGLPSNHKHIIGVLMWFADPATGAIPPDKRKSIAEISRAASLDPSTVCKILKDLETQGWLRRKQPSPADQRAGAKTGYRLLVPPSHQLSLMVPGHNPMAQNHKARPAQTQTSRSALLADTTEVLRSSTSTGKPKASRASRKLYCAEFEAWYKIYPRHTGKAEAAKSFTRSLLDDRGKPPSDRFDATDLETLMDATRRFAEHVDLKRIEPQFIKMPATWLNKGCWNDDLDMTPVAEAEEDTGAVNLFAQWRVQ